MSTLKEDVTKVARDAKGASRRLASVSARVKNRALLGMARALWRRSQAVLLANQRDLKKARAEGLSLALIDRLSLNRQRLKAMAGSLEEVAALKDPVGEVFKMWKRPNGLEIRKVRVPIGVVGIIYESRPNVTSDCIGLCLKSGNAVILRGGREAINSNVSIFEALNESALKNGIPPGSINLIRTTDRRAVQLLLKLDGLVDLIIPRGGEGLIREVVRLSKIPVIKHYKGICHTYVDEDADLNMAEKICYNAKVQRPGVCNAMETLLVHRDVAARFLPGMIKKFKEAGVEIRGCPLSRRIAEGIKSATQKDWSTEYLDLILSVKVVQSLDEAIEHITRFGSMHSEAIVTDNPKNAQRFLERVDAACVYVNASTRFTDGGQFGLGSEIGISTEKLHARGPMALEELTTYKYIVYGTGQVRE